MKARGNSEWAKLALCVAGIFQMLWGGMSVVYPEFVFRISGAGMPSHLDFWQAMGLYSIVMGVGFLCASTNPVRYWPISLMGVLAGVALPAGFGLSMMRGSLPPSLFWVVALHDLLWVLPLAWVLLDAHEQSLGKRRLTSPEIRKLALRVRTSEEMSLHEMTHRWPTLVVFLRHFGCTFCREALADLAAQREEIEKSGTRIVLVHMGDDEQARAYFDKHGLVDLPRISDPQCSLYKAFGLTRGTFGQLFGPKVWFRGFHAGILEGHGVGWLMGDGFQMPGVFLLFHGEVLNAFTHQNASDRPDYRKLVEPSFMDESAISMP